jgi:hypothetical protein
MSISFSFDAFLATMVLRPRLVVFVDNISESSIDVAFDGKMFFWYKNWDLDKRTQVSILAL